MTDLPICGATWNGVGLTYTCDQAPGHTGRHYAGHDGERIGWQPDAPAINLTYQTTPTAGQGVPGTIHPDTAEAMRAATPTAQAAPGPLRDDDQRQQHRRTLRYILDRLDPWHASASTVAELRRVLAAEQAENDHARQFAAGWRTNALRTADLLDQQNQRTRKARQQRDEANERATKAERRAERADRAADLLAGSHRRAEDAEAGRRAADNLLRATLAALGAGPNTDPVIKARALLSRVTTAESLASSHLARAEHAEAFRDAVYEELCITDSTPTDAAIGAIHGRAINISEQAERAEKAIKRATEEYDRAEKAEARAAMLERSRDHWKRKATQAQDDRDRYAAAVRRVRDECAAIGTDQCNAAARILNALGPEQPAAPDLTTPVSPREKTPARNDHPLWDLLHALTKPEPVSNDDAMTLVRAYYDAITSAPPAYDADREAYATEQVKRAIRHLAGSTTNTDLWARIGMTLGWSPEHAGNVARHRRLAGENDLSVKLTAARERINTLIRERDQAVTTLADVRRVLTPDIPPAIDRAIRRDHSLCGVEPCSDCR